MTSVLEVEVEPSPPVDAPRLEPLLRRLWRTYVTDVRTQANARIVVDRRTDRDAASVLVTAAVSLTLGEYWSRRDGSGLFDVPSQTGRLTAWAFISIVTYIVPALLVTVFVLRRPIRQLGLSVTGIALHWRVYALLFGVALPVIVLASFGDAFQAKYPFYQLDFGESFWPHLYAWWLLYALQFVALEFFFRGFLVHGLAPRLGWMSVFVMIVPYNMLHYGKPMPEAFVAIAGGIVLGTLSLKTRSIWWGAMLHITIAITMDLLALWHAGRLF